MVRVVYSPVIYKINDDSGGEQKVSLVMEQMFVLHDIAQRIKVKLFAFIRFAGV